MYLIKAVIHTQHNSDSKKNCLPKCAELHEPPTSPHQPQHTKEEEKQKETYAPATVIHANKSFSIVSFLVTFVCASKSGLESTTGGINIGSGLERVFELKKVEEIHARDWASQLQSSLNKKKSKTKKEKRTPQADSIFHPYPSLALSPSPRS